MIMDTVMRPIVNWYQLEHISLQIQLQVQLSAV